MSYLNLGAEREIKAKGFWTIIGDIDELHAKGLFNAPGRQFMVHMFSTYVFLGGFQMYMWYTAMTPLTSRAGLPFSAQIAIRSTTLLPYSMTAMVAIISDNVPIFGYGKLPYMLSTVIIGSAALLYLGTSSLEVLAWDDGIRIFWCLILVAIMGTVNDVLTQGQYAVIVKHTGPTLISFQHTMASFAGLAASFVAGIVLDIDPQWSFMFAFFFAVQAVPIIGLNFMGDLGAKKCIGNETKARDKGIIALGLLMGVHAIGLILITPYTTAFTKQMVSLAGGAVLHFVSYKTLPFTVFKINLYLFFCRIMTTGLYVPMYNFYTWDAYPGTNCEALNLPNFPNVVFQTLASIFSATAGLLAVYLFQVYVSHWNARRAFWLTTVFQCIAGLFDVFIVTRANRTALAWTGLGDVTLTVFERTFRMDDLVSFLMGNNVLEPILSLLDALPGTLLVCKIAPKNVETTILAVLSGFGSIGRSMTGITGAWILEQTGFQWQGRGEEQDCQMGLGYSGSGEGASWNGLAITLLIGDVILPLLTIPLTFIFLPDISLDDDFLEEDAYQGNQLMPQEARELQAPPGSAPLQRDTDMDAASFILALDYKTTSLIM